MFVAAKHFIDRNDLDEYAFVGGCGEKVTLNAEKLLNLLLRRQGGEAAALFAVPRFDETRRSVMWFSQTAGPVVPFGELDDGAQRSFLDRLAQCRLRVGALVAELGAAPQTGDRAVYTQLMPLLLNFPEPVEYHLFQVGEQPVVVNWGMNRSVSGRPADTVGPFIDRWRLRLEQRECQARELAENRAREQSFLGRLTRAGARSGAVTVSLLWNDRNDLDLHVECPDGSRISFENKQACGGILDVDRNAHGQSLTAEPVENVVWARRPTVPGTYGIGVHFFRQHDTARQSSFTIRLSTGGTTTFTHGEVSVRGYVRVAEFTV